MLTLTKRPTRELVFSSFDLFNSLFDGGLLTNLLNPLNHKSCEEVCRVGKEDCQNEEQGNVDQRAENADFVDGGGAHVFDEADVTLIEIVKINLERVGEDRRDGDVSGKEERYDLEVALGVELVKLQRDGEHKVEYDQVVERDGMKISKSTEEILNIAVRVDDSRHQEHI